MSSSNFEPHMLVADLLTHLVDMKQGLGQVCEFRFVLKGPDYLL